MFLFENPYHTSEFLVMACIYIGRHYTWLKYSDTLSRAIICSENKGILPLKNFDL